LFGAGRERIWIQDIQHGRRKTKQYVVTKLGWLHRKEEGSPCSFAQKKMKYEKGRKEGRRKFQGCVFCWRRERGNLYSRNPTLREKKYQAELDEA
jgi:hypothetical protein